eukprot:1264718-Pleurochrysis_carterae.AAC.1
MHLYPASMRRAPSPPYPPPSNPAPSRRQLATDRNRKAGRLACHPEGSDVHSAAASTRSAA